MNPRNGPAGTSDTPWTSRVPPMRVPAASPASDQIPPAVGMLDGAEQGARDTIDRRAMRAAPAAREIGDGVSAARNTLNEKTDQLRETGDKWVEGARATIRGSPLACVAAAFALGTLIARLTR